MVAISYSTNEGIYAHYNVYSETIITFVRLFETIYIFYEITQMMLHLINIAIKKMYAKRI